MLRLIKKSERLRLKCCSRSCEQIFDKCPKTDKLVPTCRHSSGPTLARYLDYYPKPVRHHSPALRLKSGALYLDFRQSSLIVEYRFNHWHMTKQEILRVGLFPWCLRQPLAAWYEYQPRLVYEPQPGRDPADRKSLRLNSSSTPLSNIIAYLREE